MADINDLAPPEIINGGAGSAPTVGKVTAPDYRQLQTPARVLSPGELPDNGAAARAAALGNVFKEFEDTSANIGQKLAANAGKQAGAAAGVSGNPQPKTGLAAITPYGDAFNSAAHTTYFANTQAQMEDSFSTIEQNNAGDPVGFSREAQAYTDGVVKNAPDLYQPELQNMAALRMHAGITRTQAQAIQTARSDAWEAYTSTVDDRIDSALQTAATLPDDLKTDLVQKTKADNRTMLDNLVNARAISPEKSAVLQRKFENQFQTAVQTQYVDTTTDNMLSLARAGDVPAADRAVEQYLKSPDNSDQDKNEVSAAYIKKIDTFHQTQSRVYANDIANVGQQLVQGKYGQDIEPAIHALYNKGAVSQELLHSLMDQSMRNQVSDIEDSSGNALVDAAVHGSGPKLDPANKDAVKAADKYFQTHVQMSGGVPLSDVWTSAVSSFARQTNIVPPSALSQIRIGLLNPTTAPQAAAAAERIRASNPELDPYDKDPRSAALANEINQNLRAGMQPQQAYTLATGTIDRSSEEKKVIAQNYSNLVKNDPNGNSKALQSEIDSEANAKWFGHGPAAPVALQAEYTRLVSTYYGMTQNIDSARTLAAKQVRSNWGVTQMNGAPELVKNPPERLGISPQMIRSDVAASSSQAGYTGDPAQIHLAPNGSTDASGGKVWNLVHVDPKTGESDVLLDQSNRPLIYHVPQGPDFERVRQTMINQRLSAAREQRDEDRSTDANVSQIEKRLSDYYLQPHPTGVGAVDNK